MQTHRVKRGETLASIASGYNTTEAVLSGLNGLESGDSVRAGQFLFVPQKGKDLIASAESSGAAWRRYAKNPKQKGLVDVSTRSTRFVGLVLDKAGRLRPEAVRALNSLLGAAGKHPPLPERLVRMLVQVSDAFGGRSIHVVDGYRFASYYQDSRHRLSAAIDFAIADVPNAVLCEYLREIDDVGVGYYPNSTFVHLDVRNHSAYWVDYAGPGEPPRSSPNAPRVSPRFKRALLAELDAAAERTTKAIERLDSESLVDVPKPTLPELGPPAHDSERASALVDRIDPLHGLNEPVAM